MPKRFWFTWLGGLLAIGISWWAYWTANPVSPGATGGATVSRVGALTVIVGIPTILSALRLTKIDDPVSLAFWGVPLLLALAVLAVGFSLGFLPDRLLECIELRRFDIHPPHCTTTDAVRTRALVEGVILWLAFGALTWVLAVIRNRRKVLGEAQ